MKKIIFPFAALLILAFMFTPNTYAQSDRGRGNGNSNNNNSNRNEVLRTVQEAKEERLEKVKTNLEKQEEARLRKQQKSEEIREKINERKATAEAKLAENRQRVIEHLLDVMTRRISTAITRLENIADRIESRISKIEEEDESVDTSGLIEQVNEARQLLADAQVKLDALSANVDEAVNSDNPKEAFSVVRETIQEIKDDLIGARRILSHVIGDIKGLRTGQTTISENSPEPEETLLPSATPEPIETELPGPTAEPEL